MDLNISALELPDSVACVCREYANTGNHEKAAMRDQLCQVLGVLSTLTGGALKLTAHLGEQGFRGI